MKRLLIAASTLLVSAQLQAVTITPCTKNDLNGNFIAYQNSVGQANLHTGVCQFNISNGIVSGNCEFTVAPGGVVAPGFSGPVSGSATINSNCSAEMTMDFNPAPHVTVSSSFLMQFTPDKQSYIGSWTNNFGLLGTSAGTRYSPALPATPAP